MPIPTLTKPEKIMLLKEQVSNLEGMMRLAMREEALLLEAIGRQDLENEYYSIKVRSIGIRLERLQYSMARLMREMREEIGEL